MQAGNSAIIGPRQRHFNTNCTRAKPGPAPRLTPVLWFIFSAPLAIPKMRFSCR